ncbi:MAG: hypothetical protein Q8P12_03595 [bacterium]|nr:hypothetical protein [bacterium]
MEHPVQEIPRLLQGKGWGLFPRPFTHNFTVEESVAQGPARELRSGMPYDLLPHVKTKKELDRTFAGEEFLPRITVPRGIRQGEVVRRIPEMEISLRAGTKIQWMILEIEEACVVLYEKGVDGPQVLMPLGTFLKALESMTDITARLPRGAGAKARRACR